MEDELRNSYTYAHSSLTIINPTDHQSSIEFCCTFGREKLMNPYGHDLVERAILKPNACEECMILAVIDGKMSHNIHLLRNIADTKGVEFSKCIFFRSIQCNHRIKAKFLSIADGAVRMIDMKTAHRLLVPLALCRLSKQFVTVANQLHD